MIPRVARPVAEGLEEVRLFGQSVAARIAGERLHEWAGWNYATTAERERHERTIAAARAASDGTQWGTVLELGCAAGHFTVQLGTLAHSVIACDAEPAACRLAAARCASLANVDVVQLDVERDPLPAPLPAQRRGYDAVFAMDILEYVHGPAALGVVTSKLSAALRPDGVLAVTCTRLPNRLERRWWARWLAEGGTQIVDRLVAHPALRLVHRENHVVPDTSYCPHTIAVFQRV
jgi:SAM-dependent methyltransferase